MSHHYDDNDDHQRYLQRLKKLENSGLHAIKEIRDRETSLNNEVPRCWLPAESWQW